MKRLIALVACLALLPAAGCSKKTETPAPATEEATPASTPASETPTTSEKPAEATPLEITDDMVTRYLAYQKEQLALIAKYAAESKKNLESAKGDTGKMLGQISISQRFGKELDAKLQAKRKELGMSEAEFNLLQEAAQAVALGRSMYNQMGGDAQLASMEAEQKKALAAMPEAQRAQAQAEMAKMTEGLRQMRDGFDLRQKYGEKSAAVLLKHADALATQFTEVMKMMAEK